MGAIDMEFLSRRFELAYRWRETQRLDGRRRLARPRRGPLRPSVDSYAGTRAPRALPGCADWEPVRFVAAVGMVQPLRCATASLERL